MNNFTKNLALWVIIGLLVIALFNLFQNPSGRGPQANLAFSDFLAEVENGRVRDVTIQGNTINSYSRWLTAVKTDASISSVTDLAEPWGRNTQDFPRERETTSASCPGRASTEPVTRCGGSKITKAMTGTAIVATRTCLLFIVQRYP